MSRSPPPLAPDAGAAAAAGGDAAPPAARTAWHALAGDACAERLGVALARGLACDEAARRLAATGRNLLPETRGRTRLAVFAGQFRSVLVALLAASTVLLLAMGETVDAVAILGILVLNAALGYVQERRADDALAALRRLAAPVARVRRDGRTDVVPAADLVPGDIVVVEAGDRVPADLRLLATTRLTTVEAALTGESEPVAKDTAPAAEDAVVADRRCMAWSGTTAAAGTGEGVVVGTGVATEFGRIAALVQRAEEPPTPLQTRLAAFGRALTIACGAVVAMVLVLGVLRGLPAIEMLLAAVTLAVAAVPEGLPAVVTIALAVGVSKMARRNALIRRLPAVETLGSTTVICTDKTGTLTVGEMTVRAVRSIGVEASFEGEGYRPEGAVRGDAESARRVLRAAVACSTARLVERDGEFSVAGDPTEGALVVAARKAGVDDARLESDEPVVGGVPFDAVRKRMSTVRRAAGTSRTYVKGAPEAVLPRCRSTVAGGEVREFDDAARRDVLALNDGLAERGLRVLAVATGDAAADASRDPEDGLTFLGLVGMADPPRPSARGAVAACADAGIRTVMITGDQPATALAIARELGIARDASEVMTGPALDAASDAEFAERVASVRVYARVSPEQKLRIVGAWRARGDVVAMTGDGVNDAPALRGADIGVAMGRSGTDVAKDAAAMVVTDDDFASIVAAVEEGRRIFENIRKTLVYLLGANLAEILVMAVAVAAGLPLPLLPIQLLWINLVTDGLPALALATDPAAPDVLRRPPRKPGSEIADRSFLVQTAVSAFLVMAVTVAGFLHGLAPGGSVDTARTYAFSILVIAEATVAFAARHRTRTLFEVGAFSNARLAVVVAATVALQLWSHRSGTLEGLLHTGELTWRESALTLLFGLVPVTVIECGKLVLRLVRRAGSGVTPVASGRGTGR